MSNGGPRGAPAAAISVSQENNDEATNLNMACLAILH
jgi:hypothetical protein